MNFKNNLNKLHEPELNVDVKKISKSIHDNFMKLRNHSYEKILLDEKGDKIKTIENSGMILPLDDLSISDLEINFA